MNPVKESVFNWGLDLSNSRGSYAWLLKPNRVREQVFKSHQAAKRLRHVSGVAW